MIIIHLQVEDLVSSLRTNWPSLACPSSDSTSFWKHEWDKHGTCSETVLDQHAYFQDNLNLKSTTNVLSCLKSASNKKLISFIKIYKRNFLCIANATSYMPFEKANLFVDVYLTDILPNGGSYTLTSIKNAITSCIGHVPWIECNKDKSGRYQLYQVYICVDHSGTALINCPVFPTGACGSSMIFPTF